MNYSTPKEILGSPSLKLDGMNNENSYSDVCKTISEFTCIELSKIAYFVQNFGLKTIFDNPSLMGITPDQETRLLDLKSIILFGDDDA